MKKSTVYRTVQVIAVMTICYLISVWANRAHIDFIADLMMELDEFLVILILSLVVPFICFKGLSKMMTPPSSKYTDKSGLENNESNAQEVMIYRGIIYEPKINRENINNQTNPSSQKDVSQPKDRIKYRGAYNEISPSNQSKLNPAEDVNKPKERIKYRGSYID